LIKAPATGEWTIWADQRITRRKLFHIVANPEGVVEFRSRLLHECCEYIDANEVNRYLLFWDDKTPLVVSCTRIDHKGLTQWQK
tara:strand:+ start:955 stop:1206 length:252 start_codon:yes stop_codon:yes gene_type:complete